MYFHRRIEMSVKANIRRGYVAFICVFMLWAVVLFVPALLG